ncbi:MAG: transcription-repair coupling factor, partial [Chloroflexaceae bacterium]|nr:transcription-repair coupling factor [Chloroflexaceae bacterium]
MQYVNQLTSQLAALPPLAELAATLARSSGWLRVAPLITAARTPTVAALARQPGAPRCMLYVANNADSAGRAAEDLRQWLDPAAVLLYPANDAMPYEHMSPGTEVLGQRMRVLQRLASLRHADREQQTPTIVVAPIRALLQPTLSLDEYAYATTSLQRGQQIDQDELLGRWLELGYRNAPAVDVPGEHNRRGGIVDIWPMGDEQPLRSEWFGDEIDSLRRFDAVTQRSDQRLEAALVGPPHEFPLWNRERALARIRSQDVSFMRQEARDEWELALERLERGERFEGRAFYAPFFRESMPYTSLLEHLPQGTPVFYSEALLISQAAADFDAQADKQRLARIESNELPPDFPRPYMRWAELMQTVSPQALAVDLSNNELDSDAPVYQVAGLHFSAPPLFGGQFKRLVAEIVGRLERGEQVLVVTPQAARVQELVHEALSSRQKIDTADPLGLDGDVTPQYVAALRDGASNPNFAVIHGALDEGWHLDELNLTLFTDTEIFGIRQRRTASQRRKRRERSAEERAAFLRGLQNGDYVVHIEHGIAVYEGLLRRAVGGVEREYLSLRYAGGDRLYVPVDQVDRVARYIGAGDTSPQLTRLGTQEWERAKRKARAAVQ